MSVIAFTAPVALHRLLFREGLKDFIVSYTGRLMMVGLFTLGLTIIGASCSSSTSCCRTQPPS